MKYQCFCLAHRSADVLDEKYGLSTDLDQS